MQLRFLATSRFGLEWMKRYYREHPQLDRRAAFRSFAATRGLLAAHPLAGALYEDFENVREIGIARTPFSILYTVVGDTIFVIDIRDRRGLRSAAALRRFTAEIKGRHGV